MSLYNIYFLIFLTLVIFVILIFLYPKKTLKLFWIFLAIFCLNPWLFEINKFFFNHFFEQVVFIGITIIIAILISIVTGIVLGIIKKELFLIISSILVAILFLGVGIFDLLDGSMPIIQTILRILIIFCPLSIKEQK